MRGAVAARLGRDPFTADAERRAEASIRRAQSRFVGVVRISEQERELGRRELDSTDCLELASSLELALAIAIDPRAALRPTPAPTEPAAPSPAPPSPPSAPPTPTPPPPAPTATVAPAAAPAPAPSGPHGWAALALHVSAGWLSSASAGGALGAGVRWERFSLSLQARTDLPTGVRSGSRSAEVWGVLGTLLPCVHFGWFGACVAASAGGLRVTSNLAGPVSQWSPVLLLGARVQAAIALGERWHLVPFLEGQGRLLGATVLSGDQALWSSPVFAFAGGLSLAARFL